MEIGILWVSENPVTSVLGTSWRMLQAQSPNSYVLTDSLTLDTVFFRPTRTASLVNLRAMI